MRIKYSTSLTNAHLQEHSIEVQLPFIQYYFKETPMIVPIIIGTDNENTVKKIAEALKTMVHI